MQTVFPGCRPFDIGPTGLFTAVETRNIKAPHLHEIGLPGSTFEQSFDCGLRIAECGFINKESGVRIQNSGEKEQERISFTYDPSYAVRHALCDLKK